MISSAKFTLKVIRGKPFKADYRYVRKYMLVGVEEEVAKHIYEEMEEESARVTHELGRNLIEVDETKVKCPLLFIATTNDGICAPELVKRIAEKYNASYRIYEGCHHFFCNSNWQEIAEGIYEFIKAL